MKLPLGIKSKRHCRSVTHAGAAKSKSDFDRHGAGAAFGLAVACAADIPPPVELVGPPPRRLPDPHPPDYLGPHPWPLSARQDRDVVDAPQWAPLARKPCASMDKDGLCCNPGAWNTGPMLHVANLTLADGAAWCHTSTACAGFTVKTNPGRNESIAEQSVPGHGRVCDSHSLF